ncbi:hypothetical protein KM043_005151 [Ampulex compressa]|nr:hypothetical protein KM043_005151 [Ampulex compressa]
MGKGASNAEERTAGWRFFAHDEISQRAVLPHEVGNKAPSEQGRHRRFRKTVGEAVDTTRSRKPKELTPGPRSRPLLSRGRQTTSRFPETFSF